MVCLRCVVCSVVCPRGCAVSRRYINVCNSYVFFFVINMYFDHLKFCVVCINGRRYVCCREYYVVSVECDEPTPRSSIDCPLWSSVYDCQRVECVFTSPVRTECGMFVMYCIFVSAVL